MIVGALVAFNLILLYVEWGKHLYYFVFIDFAYHIGNHGGSP